MEYDLFDRDFYPTPKKVIDEMMSFSDVRGKVVLEPSAGSGNIVDWLKSNGAKGVIACEVNKKLASMLSSKCDIIADDFLSVTSDLISHINMIVMNPPFSADEKHILHAFEIAPGGCEIIALCNSSTISKSSWNSKEREKLLELIRLYGSDEYLGSVFEDAERKTNVSVSCVRIYKPQEESMEFDSYFSLDEEEEPQADGIITYSFVRDAVSRYCDAVNRFDGVMKASQEINSLTAGIGGSHIKFGAYKESGNNYSNNISREYFKKDLQKSAWLWLFRKFDMNKYVTRGVMDDINRFVEQQQNVPFTMRNIYRMVELIVGTHGQRMEKVLVEAFDKICSFSAENSTAGEKWKTNSDYMINKRFIIPWICDYDARFSSLCEKLKVRYSSSEDINDIVKALCFLTGRSFDECLNLAGFVNQEFPQKEWGKWYDWYSRKTVVTYREGAECKDSVIVPGFFRIRGYKKGTMHFEFIDENVWMMFNLEVARIKGWQLPQSRKKKC